ncbi:MAG: DUF1780 domain-containing protein [Rhizobiales bacterium]|nr:DUF1780 domain-containing protein [Hyphomicrobiales bacterium]
MNDRDREYLDGLRRHAAMARKLWSNDQKPVRERMIVRAFLRCIGLPFAEDELRSCERDPPDALFRDARFEVMEDLGGRKRGDEWREREKKWAKAKSIEDVMEPYVPSNPVAMMEGWRKTATALGKKAAKYGAATCSQLDALLHLDLAGSHLWPPEDVLHSEIAAELTRQGWRSVSMLFPPYGAVLQAGTGAPDFLKEAAGEVRSQWHGVAMEGLFDP